MMTKLENFLTSNNRSITDFSWGSRQDEYLSQDNIGVLLNEHFLGALTLYGDGLKLTILTDIEPHTGDNVIELELEDFKQGNFRWSRI